MHAFILNTTQPQQVAEKLIKLLDLKGLSVDKFFNHPDIHILRPEPSLTIAQIRRLQQRLSQKPLLLSKQAAVLFEAQTLTVPAQNAFLKLLEEPGKDTYFCLATPNPYQLLPTILSRAQIISTTDHTSVAATAPIAGLEPEQLLPWLETLLAAGIGKRLVLVESFGKNRDSALALTLAVIAVLEEHLPQLKADSAQPNLAPVLAQSFQLYRRLKNNVNPKLALDNWALSL